MSEFLDALPVLTLADEMRIWDKNAIEFGIPENMLMENAARSILQYTEKIYSPLPDKNIWLFMGGGNNGGDAVCLARHLHDLGASTLVLHTKKLSELKGAAAWHCNLAVKDGIRFKLISESDDWQDWLGNNDLPELIFDGLLGTGFKFQLKPPLAKLIETLNNFTNFFKIPIIAIDCPSGLNTDTGLPSPVAIKATSTVTLAEAKPGLILAPNFTGDIIVKSIGFPKALSRDNPASWRLVDGRCLLRECSFKNGSYKNQYGHLFVIGGASGMSGAAHICCRAALRCGVGLVTACAPEISLPQIKNCMPEIMTLKAGDKNWDEKTLSSFKNVSAYVIGPGMSRSESAKTFLEHFLAIENRPPTIFDADALVLLGQNPSLFDLLGPEDILTPHPGEAGALLNIPAKAVQSDRVGALSKLCKLTCACVILKGAYTIIGQSKYIYRLLSAYDIPQLAIGGAGDALAGCLGALIARHHDLPALELAAYGVAWHALAGLACANIYPQRGVLTSELCDQFALVLKKLRVQKLDKEQMPWPKSL